MGKPPPVLIDICSTDDVKEGQVRLVETDGLVLAVYQVEGRFFVTDDHCTHGPGSLSEGWLSGFEIECDFHQGRYDVRTGAVIEPPPMVPIRTYEVIVLEGRLLIDPEVAGAAEPPL